MPENEFASPEEAKKYMFGPYGDKQLALLAGCGGPIFWSQARTDGHETISGASCFFVRPHTGGHVFGITADHVIAGYLGDKERFGSWGCLIQPYSFDGPPVDSVNIQIEDVLIDRCESRDIATFKISEEQFKRLGFSPISLWPPRVPVSGQSMLLGGFPKTDRKIVAPRTAEFGFYHILNQATTVTKNDITIVLDSEGLITDERHPPPPEGYDPGGMSGGPALTISKEGGVERYYIGGVVINSIPEWKVYTIGKLDCLKSDGTISPLN